MPWTAPPTAPRCPACKTSVFPAESVMAGDRLPFHKQCVKCCKCQKSLSPSSLNNHQNKLYCNNCYDEVFMSQDYSLGSYGGIVTPEDIKRKEDEERRRLEKAERAKAEKRCPTCELKVKFTTFLYILLTEDGNKNELPHSRMLSVYAKTFFAILNNSYLLKNSFKFLNK